VVEEQVVDLLNMVVEAAEAQEARLAVCPALAEVLCMALEAAEAVVGFKPEQSFSPEQVEARATAMLLAEAQRVVQPLERLEETVYRVVPGDFAAALEVAEALPIPVLEQGAEVVMGAFRVVGLAAEVLRQPVLAVLEERVEQVKSSL
jgi:hypothetical protein